MTGLALGRSYPLAWPQGRPRTDSPKPALFRNPEAANGRLSIAVAERRLIEQLGAMTRTGKNWRTTDIVLSTNIRYTADGRRDQSRSRAEPADRGVAVYFRLDGRPHVLACDRWDTIADNIAAIAAHIEALRGQERWGCADLAQAFAGHVALPPPEQWWQVLGVPASAGADEIEAAYRRLAKSAHPDTGGSTAAMARLNAARDAGKAAQR